ncbi:MAG TPA: YihY/virulence factor BrkB family protein [Terriglobales bacterium]|nr:YihY/virulence factor BrkB family protein [Terriglobales bacterium]
MTKSKRSAEEPLKSLWKLGGLTTQQLTQIVLDGIGEDDLLGRAAELAYNFVLALFPFIILLLSLFGLFALHRTELLHRFLSHVSLLLPPAAFALFSNSVTEIVRTTGGGKLTFSIVLTLWFASGAMSSMISTLNAAYRVRESRSFVRYRAVALGLTIAISILLVWALLLMLVGGRLSRLLAGYLGFESAGVIASQGIQWFAILFFLCLSFSLIYYFGPNLEGQQWHWITPGSIFGVFLWLAASGALRCYLHFFNSYSKTYGSLGAFMILLVWLYVTGLAFLIGGEINAKIEYAAAFGGHPDAKKPGGQRAA